MERIAVRFCIFQVKTLCFHPVQPWLAYADVNQGLTVWDWSIQQVVSAIQDIPNKPEGPMPLPPLPSNELPCLEGHLQDSHMGFLLQSTSE